jgi:hypothetical protein
MSLARVGTFENVDRAQIEKVTRQVREDPRPDDIPASEFVMLHDPDSDTALAIVFFDDEDAYRRGGEALNAMPVEETPGRRTSVARYRVVGRMKA